MDGDQDSTKVLALIDGSSIVHRAIYAARGNAEDYARSIEVGPEITEKLLTGVLYDLDPRYVLCARECEGRTRRSMLHEDYQAHRSEKPADFYVAREACFQQIVEMIGHPLLSAPGAEGDDVLASLAHRVCKPGWKAVIATSDKDLVACVGPHTDLLLVRSGQERIRYTPENAGEVFGVMPARVTLYKAIAGDQSDNISGVPGLGPVAARRYANEYTMPDDVMAAVTAGEITGAAAKKLTEHEGALRLSYDLAQLDRGLELEVDWNLARVSHAAV